MTQPEAPTDQQIGELINQATELHETGKLLEAEDIYRSLFKWLPNAWQLLFNYALLLYEDKRYEESISIYRKAISLKDDSNDLYYNLAICQNASGYPEDAVMSYLQALALDPADHDSRYNLAGCYHYLGDFDAAYQCYHTILQEKKDHLSSLNNLAYICHKTGRHEEAATLYQRLAQLDPENNSARYMHAALLGKPLSSPPPDYIREVFDNFAGHYDSSMIKTLEYAVPDQMLRFVTQQSITQNFSAVLDLGCGTGLLGDRFRPLAGRIDGVDLSPAMAAAAEKKGIYNTVFTEEINNFLEHCEPECYDLLLAADVLNYLGRLERLFRNACRVARPGSLFIFSVEDPGSEANRLILKKNGRFGHSADYISETSGDAGWHLAKKEHLRLRREYDSWITGTLFCLHKRDAT